jgi:hypothetical protein
MIQVVFPEPDPDFLPIPDPGVKKALYPGSGSAALLITFVHPDPNRFGRLPDPGE